MRTHSPVPVAVIGCGNFAGREHLPNLMRIPECRLAAVCDLNGELAESARARYGAGRAETDYRKVLADPAIAAVVVVVRDDLQAAISIEALAAGKHVYVEKPLAETPEAAAGVVAAQKGAGKKLAVGFNRRYAPIYRALRETLAADGGGKNFHLRMADDAWRWAVGYPPGYGVKHDVCHFFDLLRWLTGAEVEWVCAAESRPDDDAILLKLGNGAVATVVHSGHATMDLPKERVEIITTRGSVQADDFVELKTFGHAGQPHRRTFAGHTHPDGEYMHKHLFEQEGLSAMAAVRRATWEVRERLEREKAAPAPDAAEARRYARQMLPNFMRDQGWYDALRVFVQAVADGSPTDHATAEDALAAARVAGAVVKSRATGERVRMAEFA